MNETSSNKTNSFKDLIVWQKSMLLTKEVYELCKKLPKDEIFALSSQIRRSAVSVPSNIAEGYGRRNKKEYLQFLGVAYGSACELETQLILCKDLFEIDSAACLSLLKEVQKMLGSMQSKLKN